MYKIVLSLCLLASINGYSQDTPAHQIDTSSTRRAIDNAQRYIDSMKQVEQDNNTQRGLDNLMRYQDEQKAKQKKQAIIYIVMGVFFLVVLIVGLMRKRKK